MTKEKLTWEQIKQQYPEQYVGLSDITREQGSNHIVTAVVSCTSQDCSYEDMLDQALNGVIYMTYPTADERLVAGIVL